jgi:hypothetical protein
MSKHTPGPWTLDIGDERHHAISAKNWFGFANVVTATLHADGKIRTHARGMANARLIKAAPDLLAAAEVLLENSGHISPFGGESSVKAVRAAGKYVAAIDALRAAVAKAKS